MGGRQRASTIRGDGEIAAATNDEHHAQGLLQGCEPSAYGGAVNVEQSRGPRHRARFAEGDQDLEVAPLRFHAQNPFMKMTN